MIPCKRTKCLKYPVCQSKQIIECEPLVQYFKLIQSNKFKRTHYEAWEYVNKWLPNTIELQATEVYNQRFVRGGANHQVKEHRCYIKPKD